MPSIMHRPRPSHAVRAVLLLGVAATIALTVQPGKAQEDILSSITVEGVGTAAGEPDLASFELGIAAVSTDLQSVLNDTIEKSTAIMQALLDFGVAQDDIQNAGIEIVPEEMTDPASGVITGEHLFHVRSTLRVTIHDLSELQTLITMAVNSGANSVDNFAVVIDDPSALEQEARQVAIASANERAEAVATSLGLTLAEPMIVSETIEYDGLLAPPGGAVPGAVLASGDSSGSGTLVLVVRIRVVFGIRQPQ